MRNARKRRKTFTITDDYGNELTLRRCNKCSKFKEYYTGFYQDHSYGSCRTCKNEAYNVYRENNRERIKRNQREWYRRLKDDEELFGYYLSRKKPQPRPSKEKAREYSRRYYAKIYGDPKRYAEFLAKRRMYARIRREREGAESFPQKGAHHLKFKEKDKRVELPAGPVSEWVERKLADGYNGSAARLALACETTERTITRFLNRERPTVNLNTIDLMLTNEGTTEIGDLYPDLDKILARE